MNAFGGCRAGSQEWRPSNSSTYTFQVRSGSALIRWRGHRVAQLPIGEGAADSLSSNFTQAPWCTMPARSSASQLVRRMQP